MPTFTPASSAPGIACAGCGWVESPGATECRSCGDPMPGGRPSARPVPVLPPPPAALLETPPYLPPKPQPRPVRPVVEPPASGFSRLGALIFQRRTLALLSLIGLFWRFSDSLPVTHPPGILIKEEPVQGPVAQGTGFWQTGTTNVRALASYHIKGRVLHLERYRWDTMADLAPLDLGVGWSIMSDEANVSRCSFSSASRFLTWWWSDAGFPAEAATRCMTNMHMLPANDRVRHRLLSLRKGETFQARGYLVEVMRPNMAPWTSSLSRLDTGDGACEIMWVESLTPLP